MKLSFEFSVPKSKPMLNVAIPSSLLEDCSTLREKTVKLGFIGRACSIFRVEEILIFKDFRRKTSDDSKLIKQILEYLETPQYLRKRLFKKDSKLRFVGLLPPLRTPHHPLIDDINKLPNLTAREGIIVRKIKSQYLVDVGLKDLLLVTAESVAKRRIGERVTVLINKATGEHKLVDPKNLNVYWGFKVKVLREGLRDIKKHYGDSLIIATSKKGQLISDPNTLLKLKSLLHKTSRTVILFGSPRMGLFEMSIHQGLNLNEISDLVVNFIPNQGTSTVRTEEAIFSTLSIINLLIHLDVPSNVLIKHSGSTQVAV